MLPMYESNVLLHFVLILGRMNFNCFLFNQWISQKIIFSISTVQKLSYDYLQISSLCANHQFSVPFPWINKVLDFESSHSGTTKHQNNWNPHHIDVERCGGIACRSYIHFSLTRPYYAYTTLLLLGHRISLYGKSRCMFQ